MAFAYRVIEEPGQIVAPGRSLPLPSTTVTEGFTLLVIEVIATRTLEEIVEDARKPVWLLERKKASINPKQQSDLRHGISCLFPRVQMLNRVTLLKILLINLETAFPRMKWKSRLQALSLTSCQSALRDR